MRALLLVLLLGLPSAAAAAPADAAPGDAAAVSLVEQAAVAYRAGRYVAAAELFLAAYDLAAAPAQLRNAAKAYTKAERLDAAAEAWRRYRALPDLDPAEYAEADAELRLLDERRAGTEARAEAEVARAEAVAARAEAEAARDVPPPQLITPPAPQGPPIAAYALVGAGGAALVSSAIVFFHAGSRLSDVDSGLATTDGAGRITGIHRDQAQSELDGVGAERIASAALLGVGLAAAGAGIVWWLLADDGAAEASAQVGFQSGGASAVLRF